MKIRKCITAVLSAILFHFGSNGWAQNCDIYPIALPQGSLIGKSSGSVVDVLQGNQPGNFGWLTWAGSPSEPALVKSLTIPGDSDSYINPDDRNDSRVSVGDWVQGKPGVSNSQKVRAALDELKSTDIVIPVWGESRGQGDKTAYRIVSFARVRVLSYHLPQQNRITAQFLGYVNCGVFNRPPIVDAGPDQTITLTSSATLAGSVNDDENVSVLWSVHSGPGIVTFQAADTTNTVASFSMPGTYVIRLTANDSEWIESDDLVVTVNRENQPPVATPTNVTTEEDSPVAIPLSGTDVDGDSLTFIVDQLPSYGTLSGTPPALIYAPIADYNGNDSFTFKVSDGGLESAVVIVPIAITPVNDAPVADLQLVSTDEDAALEIVLSGSDVEGNALSFTVVTQPLHGTLSGAISNLTYVPFLDYHGADNFTYTVSDGELDSAPTDVTILVVALNDPPDVFAGSDQVTSQPASIVLLDGIVTDDNFPGFDSITTEWSLVNGSGSVVFSDPTNRVTAVHLEETGVYTLRLSATDGFFERSDEVQIVFNASPIVIAGSAQTNTLPSIVSLNGSATDDGLPAGSVLEIQWEKVSGPGAVVFENPTQLLTSAVFSESGIYVLRLNANDSLVGSSSDVTVVVNRAPLVDAGSDQITTNFQVTLTGTASDDGIPFASALSVLWEKVSGPGTVIFASPVANTSALFSETGTYVLRLTADDSLVHTSDEVTIVVNAAPLVSAGEDQFINFPEAIVLNGVATDEDQLGEGLGFEWTQVAGPGVVTFESPHSLITSASFNQAGSYVLRLTAQDAVSSASDEVSIVVNQPPTALSQNVTTDEDVSVNILLIGSDFEASDLTFTIVQSPSHGVLSGTLPNVIYSPATNFHGADTFIFKVNDGRADSEVAVVGITIVPVDDSSIAHPQIVTLDEDTSREIILTGDDLDGEPLAFVLLTNPTHGSLNPAPGALESSTLVYTPNENFHGSDEFTFSVSSGGVTSAPATISLNVLSINDAPKWQIPGAPAIAKKNTTLVFGGTQSIQVMDVDASVGPLRLSMSVNHGALTVAETNGLGFVDGANGSSYFETIGTLSNLNVALNGLTYLSETNYLGADLLTLTINDQGHTGDGGALSDSNQISISIVSTNAAPLITSVPTTIATQVPPTSTKLVDLSLWSPVQYEVQSQEDARWVLTETNSVAIQEVNADPSILLSDFSLSRDVIQGRWSVESGSDDDFVGFVFGYQDAGHFYLFDWKSISQDFQFGFAEVGMSVKVVSVDSALVGNDLWPTYPANSNRVRTIYHNTIPYQDFTEYQFTLSFHPGAITILVHQGATLLATINLDDTTYTGGKFGFYNYSQEMVRYAGFTRRQLTTHTYSYDVDATDADGDPIHYSLLTAPTGMSIDAVSGLIEWSPATNQTGTVSVVVQVLDDNDGIGDQSFSIDVPPAILNTPPLVLAGPDRSFADIPTTINLEGIVLDDAIPTNVPTSIQWTELAGIGNVSFGNANAATTEASFDTAGVYVLLLAADDSIDSAKDIVEVRAGTLCSIEASADLVAWWPGSFSGTEVKGNHHAVPESETTYGEGKVGAAFQINAPSDFYRVQSHADLDVGSYSSGFSMDFWMRPAGSGTFLGWTNGIRATRTTAGDIRFTLTSSGTTFLQTPAGSIASPDSVWTHVGLTYERDSGRATIYINGLAVTNRMFGSDLLSTAEDFYLGYNSGSYAGHLDEVSLYRRPLNPQEMNEMFAAGSTGKCPIDLNTGPSVFAGSDLFLPQEDFDATLSGEVSDDGLPNNALTVGWSKVSGPGSVNFANADQSATTATFSTNGIYVLQLTANDGSIRRTDLVTVRVGTLCTVEDMLGLVAWWPGNGTEEDVVGGLDCWRANGATYGDGKVASGFRFDGQNDFVIVPAHSNLNISSQAGMTIEFWLKPDNFVTRSLLSWNNGTQYGFGVWQSGSSLYVFPRGTDNAGTEYDTGVSLTTNAWQHVVVSWERNSGLVKTYLNGILRHTQSIGARVPQTTYDFYMGSRPGGGVLRGGLDEVSLYDQTLNEEQIHTLYASGEAGKCPIDSNKAPIVYAGNDQFLAQSNLVAALNGNVADDGLPNNLLSVGWSKFSGPGAVHFANSNKVTTSATFGTNGIYVLQLTANDGSILRSDLVTVRVGSLCTIEDMPGLVAWWPGNGSAEDIIGGRSCWLANGLSYGAGKVASGFLFDGQNDLGKVQAHSTINFTNEAGTTVEFWVKPDNFAARSLVSWHNGTQYGFGVWQEGSLNRNIKVYVRGTDNAVTEWDTGAQLITNTWQHVIVSWDKNTGEVKTYLNGIFRHSQSIGTRIPETSYDLYLGSRPGGAVLRGGLDEISLYNRALNEEEAYALYAAGDVGKCPVDPNRPPVIHAGFDQSLADTNVVATITGYASDDDLPSGSVLGLQWSKYAGPGNVTFGSPTAEVTTASFDLPGLYVLQLTADDTSIKVSDLVEIRVASPCTVQDLPGLVGWWPANGTAVNLINGDSGVLVNGPGYSVGKVGSAFNFDGVDDYIRFGSKPEHDLGQSLSGFTIEFWAKANSTGGERALLSWNNLSSNGVHVTQVGAELRAYLVHTNTTALTSSNAFFNNTWRHVALVYDRSAGEVKLYSDGLFRFATTIGNVTMQTASELRFGHAVGKSRFLGQLDEVSFYNRPLSATEVQGIHGAGIAGKCISPQNQVPFVLAGGNRTIYLPTNSITLHGAVFDDGLPAGQNLDIAWSQLSGPVAATIQDSGLSTPTITFTNTGVYAFELSANDGELTAADTATVTVLPDPRTPPVVNITSPTNGTLFEVAAGGAINLPVTVTASDADGVVTRVEFFVNNSSVGIRTNSPYSLTVSNLSAGSYLVAAVAWDNTGASSTSSPVSISVYTDTGAPTVEIISPEDSATVTAPTSIIGTANSPLLQSYQVQYRFKAAEGTSPAAWNTFATGAVSVVNAPLGVLDPTLLLNGIYELRVMATDSRNRTGVSEIHTIVVDGKMKVGHFAVSFNDLAIPVPGLPLQIMRTYDSRAAAAGVQGDFGVGWTLDIRNVRLQKNRALGRNWEETTSGGDFPVYALEPLRSRIVTITFPDGRQEKFAFTPNPTTQLLLPITYPKWRFTPIGNTRGTLVPASYDDPDGSFLMAVGSVPGPVDLYDLNFFSSNPLASDQALNRYPTLFRYTTPEGYRYLIDEIAGLQSLKDPNGNTLLVTTNSLTWTNAASGTNSLSIVFQRDYRGRITNILDAAGNAVSYTYSTNGNLTAFTDRVGQTNGFFYNKSAFPHYLTEMSDAQGITPFNIAYGSDGRLIGHTDALGQVITYEHDLANGATSVLDRNGYRTSHEYDADGNLIRSIDAMGAVTRMSYDSFGRRLSVSNPLGETTRFYYNSTNGALVAVVNPLGETNRFAYNSQGQVTAGWERDGTILRTEYNASNKITNAIDALGHSTRYVYNSLGKPVVSQNALGYETRSEYDAFGNLLRSTNALGHVNEYRYDANNKLIEQVLTRTTNNVSHRLTNFWSYDAHGRVLEAVAPNGSTTRSVYDANGRQIADIDEMGRAKEFHYDIMGRLTLTKYPDGTSEGTGYDAEDRKVAVTNRLGKVTRFIHDPLGRVVLTLHPDSAGSTNQFNAAGRLVATTDARGNRTLFGHDALGRVTSITNALGEVSRFTFDLRGNQITSIDPLGRITTNVFDLANRLVAVHHPDGTFRTTEYDALGRRLSETDESGGITSFGYDPVSRLTAITNALGEVTRYEYSEMGEQTAQIDASGRITRYQYDDRGRRTSRILPLGQSDLAVYDGIGNMVSYQDFNGNVTTYQYDALNRLLQKTPDPLLSEPSVTFTYNAAGQRTSMTDASGVTTYVYDSRNRLIEKNTPQGTLTYSYDVNGNVTSIQSSNENGTDVTYEYDALNRLTAVNDSRLGRTVYTYGATGNLRNFTYPNGVNHFYEYDALNRMTNLTAGTVLNSLTDYAYTLAPTGHRLSVQERTGRVVNYAYDALNRVTTESVSGALSGYNGTVTYNYDPVGNRLARNSSLPGILAASYAYDENDRLTSDLSDNNGNTRSATLRANTVGSPVSVNDRYDFENRLIDRNNGQVTVVYNGDGHRVRKTVGGVTTHYLVDELNPTGHAQVVEELTSSSTITVPAVTRVYTWAHVLLSQDQVVGGTGSELSWQSSFYSYDGQSSVRQLTDINGLVTDTYDYDAFGNLISRHAVNGTPTANNYLYQGEQFDHDLGLYYLRARYADPDRGRFWTMDSFEGFGTDPASLHKYTFNHNDPINRRDPSGHFSLSESQTVTALAPMVRGMVQALQRMFTTCNLMTATMGGLVGGAFGEAVGAGITGLVQAFTGEFNAAEIAQAAAEGYAFGFAEGFLLGLNPYAFLAYNTYMTFQAGLDFWNVINDPQADPWERYMHGITFVTSVLPVISPRMARTLGDKLRKFCFVEGTQVAVENGTKPIEEIQEGDLVWSQSDETGEISLKPVNHVFANIAAALVVLTAGTNTIQATPEHPFWIADQGWKAAGQILVGDELITSSGQRIGITQTENKQGRFTVYNFAVEDFHTYFVGPEQWLSHNACDRRSLYMGGTPGQDSPTGKIVIARMRAEGTVREMDGITKFRDSQGTWRPLSEADMSHRLDCVRWWNDTGRFFGARSAEVKRWMADPDNYTLEYGPINRSKGAAGGEEYLSPDNPYRQDQFDF